MGFRIYKIWQILKRFAGTKTLAKTSYFWGVTTFIINRNLENNLAKIEKSIVRRNLGWGLLDLEPGIAIWLPKLCYSGDKNLQKNLLKKFNKERQIGKRMGRRSGVIIRSFRDSCKIIRLMNNYKSHPKKNDSLFSIPLILENSDIF